MTFIKNKKGLTARNWIISLILFSGLFTLGTVIFADLAFNYGNSGVVDEGLAQRYNVLQNSTNLVSQSFDAVQQGGGLSLIGTFQVLFASTLTIIQIILSSFPIMSSLVANFTSDFGVPTVIANIIFPVFLSIITIIIIFAIVNSNTRKDL